MTIHQFCCLFITICLLIAPFSCQSQQQKEKNFSALKSNLEKTKSRPAYDSLHFLLTEHYTDLTANERKELRKTLEKYAVWPSETMCPESEPGTKITISGHVTDKNGQPVKGAKVHIFQTNHRGFYAPTDSISGKMQEGDARLNGYLTTDSSGAFTIHTIRPASYPKQYEGRFIPQHIHLNTRAAGFRENAVQMVFEDDPAMKAHWVDWAKELGYPIVKMTYGDVRAYGKVELRLTTF